MPLSPHHARGLRASGPCQRLSCIIPGQGRGDKLATLIENKQDRLTSAVATWGGSLSSGPGVVALHQPTDRPTNRCNAPVAVREKGLEPSHLAAQEPKSCVSASFTTPAQGEVYGVGEEHP